MQIKDSGAGLDGQASVLAASVTKGIPDLGNRRNPPVQSGPSSEKGGSWLCSHTADKASPPCRPKCCPSQGLPTRPQGQGEGSVHRMMLTGSWDLGRAG